MQKLEDIPYGSPSTHDRDAHLKDGVQIKEPAEQKRDLVSTYVPSSYMKFGELADLDVPDAAGNNSSVLEHPHLRCDPITDFGG